MTNIITSSYMDLASYGEFERQIYGGKGYIPTFHNDVTNHLNYDHVANAQYPILEKTGQVDCVFEISRAIDYIQYIWIELKFNKDTARIYHLAHNIIDKVQVTYISNTSAIIETIDSHILDLTRGTKNGERVSILLPLHTIKTPLPLTATPYAKIAFNISFSKKYGENIQSYKIYGQGIIVTGDRRRAIGCNPIQYIATMYKTVKVAPIIPNHMIKFSINESTKAIFFLFQNKRTMGYEDILDELTMMYGDTLRFTMSGEYLSTIQSKMNSRPLDPGMYMYSYSTHYQSDKCRGSTNFREERIASQSVAITLKNEVVYDNYNIIIIAEHYSSIKVSGGSLELLCLDPIPKTDNISYEEECDDSTKYVGEFKNNKKDGTWKKWKLVDEEEWKDGKLIKSTPKEEDETEDFEVVN